MKNNIYLDNAATTPIKEEVLEAMLPFFNNFYGNPSSIYSLGNKSKIAIEKARDIIAKSLNVKNKEIFFTASGSESDNWAIRGVAYANKEKGKHIITTKIEHHAVLNTCKYLEKNGFDVTYLDVDKTGLIRIEDLKKAIGKDTILISIMYANNEVGTIQPIDEIGKICREQNIYFHTDAVQAYGLLDIDVEKLDIDLLSLSGHKINAPKGVGALYIKEGITIDNLIFGGNQERKHRAGTENVASIVGLGKAVEILLENKSDKYNKIKNLNNLLRKELLKNIENINFNGNIENSLPSILNVTFKNSESEAILMNLDMKGVMVSSGSACTSGSIESSHVLRSMGVSEIDANSSIRISIGDQNTEQEILEVVKILSEIIDRIRKVY